jgi:hypothetical protein
MSRCDSRCDLLETVLLVLITRKLIPVAPEVLIPIGLDEAPALDAVSHSQVAA